MKKPPKPVKEKPIKPPKPALEPTRKLSRQRKAVNYSENRSRSPTPRRELEGEGEADLPPSRMEVVSNDASTIPMLVDSFASEAESMGPRSESVAPSASEEDTSTTMADSSAEIVEENQDEHPPIVLRISKVSAHFFLYLSTQRLCQNLS